MTSCPWNSRVIVKRLQEEYPALIVYAMHSINYNVHGERYVSKLPECSAGVLNVIIRKIVAPTLDTDERYDRFIIMGVPNADWLLLYKKTYEWIDSQENINELIAFQML